MAAVRSYLTLAFPSANFGRSKKLSCISCSLQGKLTAQRARHIRPTNCFSYRPISCSISETEINHGLALAGGTACTHEYMTSKESKRDAMPGARPVPKLSSILFKRSKKKKMNAILQCELGTGAIAGQSTRGVRRRQVAAGQRSWREEKRVATGPRHDRCGGCCCQPPCGSCQLQHWNSASCTFLEFMIVSYQAGC